MSQPPQQLQYAQYHERRVPMHIIVISILAATFLLFIGVLAAVRCLVIAWDVLERQRTKESGQLLYFVPLSIVFLLAGITQLAGTIRQLRGTTARSTAIERGFRLLNTDGSGRTYEDRYQ